VAGARQVVELFRPVLGERDAALLAEVDRRFARVQALLDALRTGPGDTAFVSYASVDDVRRRALADAVDAAAEPLSRLPAALTAPGR
jgi:iron uptake system component EfeO